MGHRTPSLLAALTRNIRSFLVARPRKTRRTSTRPGIQSAVWRGMFEALEERRLFSAFVVNSVLDDGSAGTLRNAVTQANLSSDPSSTISFDASVFYVGSSNTTISLTNGALPITSNLTINGPGSSVLAIDAALFNRDFEVSSNLSINNITVSGGRATDASTNGSVGGAFYVSGSLTIANSIVTGNQAVGDTASYITGSAGGNGQRARGGAVFVDASGTLIISQTSFTNNSALAGSGADGGTSVGYSGYNGGGGGNASGGAIYASSGSSVTIDQSTLTGNTAKGGAGGLGGEGLAITTSTGAASGSSGNGGFASGGAIYFGTSVTSSITQSSIAGNTAMGGYGASGTPGATGLISGFYSYGGQGGIGGNAIGGAITNSGTLTITNSTLSGNAATAAPGGNAGATYGPSTQSGIFAGTGGTALGGAIMQNVGSVSIVQSTLSGNSAVGAHGGAGGGLAYNVGPGGFGGTGEGGAIGGSTGNVSIIQSTVAENSIVAGSGGIAGNPVTGYTSQGPGVPGNAYGAGIFVALSFITISNTILANHDTASISDVNGSLYSGSANNLISDGSGNLTGNANILGTTAHMINPVLSVLTSVFGSPAQVMILSPLSPAANAGDNAIATGASLTNDQASGNRIIDSQVDIGAYEAVAFGGLIVNSTSDTYNYVPGDNTLRQAIGYANAKSGNQTITFDASVFDPFLSSTILLDSTLGEMAITDTTGSVIINSPQYAAVTVDGNNATRIFNVLSGATANFSKIIITHGYTLNTYGHNISYGAGIRVDGTVTISNSTMTSNVSQGSNGADGVGFGATGQDAYTGSGGAIYVGSSGILTINQSDISGNSAIGGSGGNGYINPYSGTGGDGGDAQSGIGGAIASVGMITINDSTISNNNATGGNGGAGGQALSSGGHGGNGAIGAGGGIWNIGTLVINNSTLSGNTAKGGDGGAAGRTVTPNATTGVIFAGSGGYAYGGALHSVIGQFTITQTTIADNSAIGGNGGTGGGGNGNTGAPGSGNLARGGGISFIALSGAASSITQSTIANNQATAGSVGAAGVPLPHFTPEGNGNIVLSYAGGIYDAFNGIILTNTIVAQNTADQFVDIVGNLDGSSSYNLIGDGTGSLSGNHNLLGSSTQLLDPGFGPLQNNGGLTSTLSITSLSPAAENGSDAAATTAGLTLDQTGGPRVVGDHVDIGAYEAFALSGGLIITTNTDPTAYVEGVVSLRHAVIYAMWHTGDHDIALSSPDTLTLDSAQGQIEIFNGIGTSGTLTIEASSASSNFIDAGGHSRIFQIDNGSTVIISGFTLKNGRADSSSLSTASSGGAILDFGALTINNSVFTGNTAVGAKGTGYSGYAGAAAYGGAITVGPFGNLTITASTFSSNSAVGGDAASNPRGGFNASGGTGSGGAIYLSPSSVVTITTSTFTGNTATGGRGQPGYPFGTPMGYAGNGGTASGGAIAMAYASLTLTNSTLSGNSALGGTGGDSATQYGPASSGIVYAGSGGNAYGGAIATMGAWTLVQSTLTGNSVTGGTGGQGGGDNYNTGPGGTGGSAGGGAIFQAYGSIYQSTIAQNSAVAGAGGPGGTPTDVSYNSDGMGTSGHALGGGITFYTGLHIQNSIVASNISGDILTSPFVTADTSSYYNLIGDGSGGLPTTNNILGTPTSPIDPLLGALANNGGPTKTMLLAANSPAANTGSNALIPIDPDTGNSFTTDQRGEPRILNFIVNIGAAESPAPLATTTSPVTFTQPSDIHAYLVTLTATVTPLASTLDGGTVEFFDGTVDLGAGDLDTFTGVATLDLPSLSVGDHSIKAVYSGDTNFNGSDSGTSVLSLYDTTTTLNVSFNPIAVGDNITFYATVTTTGQPAGDITFYDGISLGSATVDPSTGLATFTTTFLSTGTYYITSFFDPTASGTTAFARSQSTTIPLVVTNTPTTTTLTSDTPGTAAIGTSITFTSTVTGGSATPTGSVTFYSNGLINLGTVTLDGSGVATLTTSALLGGDNSITAVYTPDGSSSSLLDSTSSALIQTIDKILTSTTLSASSNPAVATLPLTLTATVTPVSGTATGRVDFYDQFTNTIIGSGDLDGSGIATFTTSSLAVGSHTFVALYAGSGTHQASNSGFSTTVSVISRGATTTTLTSTASGSVLTATPITFTASISSTYAPVTSGTVTFFNGTTTLGTGTVDSSGMATLITSTVPPGTNTITATYAASGIFATSTSTSVSVVIVKRTTSVTLLVQPTVGVVGLPVTLTASVVGSSVPTGRVDFYDQVSNSIFGSGTVDGSGIATLVTSSLSLGNHTLVALYTGSAVFASSSSGFTTTISIQATAPTSIALTTNLSGSVPVGTSATLSASVTSTYGTPAGSVTFFDNGTINLGTVTLDVNGLATFTTTALNGGINNLTAVYSGNSSFSTVTSSATSVTLTKKASTTTMSTSPNPVLGSPVILTATVTIPSGTGTLGTPTGRVDFYDAATFIGSGTVDINGVATTSTSSFALGNHTLTALYSGSAYYAASNSAYSNTITVTKAPTSVALTSDTPSTVGVGTAITFTASATSSYGSLSGSITFYNNGTVNLGTVALASGVATLTTASITGGTNNITAVYTPDGGSVNFLASTSNTVSQPLTKRATTTTMSTSPASGTAGQPVTLTATVTIPLGFGTLGYPTGRVDFYDAGTLLGSGTIDASGIATFTTSSFAVGTHTLTSLYSGSGYYGASNSGYHNTLVVH